ncbi:hypothetical protein BG003_006414 [Podila horticola]|nr:hypothetical protein BG003_006414 [Podila horticola]
MPQQPPSPSPSPSPSPATSHAHALTPNSPNSIATSSPSSSSRSNAIVTPTAASTSSATTTPTATPRRKRPLAKRSCSNCREKKARCELPDIHVPSSKEPVAEAKRCHRCNVLDIDCVVWDGDRKRKPKPKPPTPALEDGVSGLGNITSMSTSTSPASSDPSSGSLSELAHVAEIMGASESTLASVSSSLFYLIRNSNKPVGVGLTTPVQDPFFKEWSDIFLRASGPAPSRSAAEEAQIPELLLCSSLWISLRIWEGYFVFLKSTCGVLRDLDELVEAAKTIIAVDGIGNKINGSPVSAEGISASTLASQEVDAERKLRSAGRTNLAYRLQTMALLQRTLASIEDIITAAKTEAPTSATGRFEVSGQRQDKILELALVAMQEQTQIEEHKQLDMAPYTLYNPANLAEEWSQIEAKHLMSILCTFSTGSIAAGHVVNVGGRRLDLCEKIVSSFVFFNRRLTITTTPEILKLKKLEGVMELTGAPMFLSCSLVIDACKLFVEGVAFVLVKHSTIQNNYDARLLSMMQAAQRLEEMDGNRYEEDNNDEHGETAQKLPRSICQVSAQFIRDMVETLQKWKLASSIYRRPAVVANARRTEPKSGVSSATTAQGASESTEKQGESTSDIPTAMSERPPMAGMPEGYLHTTATVPMLYSQPPTQHYYAGSYGQLGYPATGAAQFGLQPQFWPMDMNNARHNGHMENPMFPGAAGPSSAPGPPTTDGAFHAPLFDNFFESFFPNPQ